MGGGGGLTGEQIGWVERGYGGMGEGGSTSHSASQETNIICSLKKGTRGTYCTEGKVQLCLEHKFGLVPRRTCGGESGGGRTTGREGNERIKLNKKNRKWRGLSPFHFPAHTTSRRRFHIYLEQRQLCGADVGTPGSGRARYVNSAAYDMTWRIAPPAVAAQDRIQPSRMGPVTTTC